MFKNTHTGSIRTFETKTLDNLKLKKVDILKIDVEGFEYDVLQGASKLLQEQKPRLILEVHSIELRGKCETFLSKLDYKLIFEGRKIWADVENLDVCQDLFFST